MHTFLYYSKKGTGMNGADLTTFSANPYRWIPAFAGMTLQTNYLAY